MGPSLVAASLFSFFMGYRLHPKHSATPALHESAVEEVEALQLRTGDGGGYGLW